MNPYEESHALEGLPTTGRSPAASAIAASAYADPLFSTKLPDQPEDTKTPASPGNPLEWLQSSIITPTRTRLQQVNVKPMVDSLRSVRARLSFGNREPSLSSRSFSFSPASSTTRPTLIPASRPEGVSPSHDVAPGKHSASDWPSHDLALGNNSSGRSPRSPSGSSPTQDSTIILEPSTAGSSSEEKSSLPSSEPSSPALLAMQQKLSSLETRFDSISSQFSDQAHDVNYGLSVLNTTCDRLKFDLDKTAEVHHQALEGHMAKVATIVSSSEDRTAAALQAFQAAVTKAWVGCWQ